MPVQHAIWTVADNPMPLAATRLASEQKLEEMIVHDPRILSGEWMLIGQRKPPATVAASICSPSRPTARWC